MEDIIDIIVTETTNLIEITSQASDEVIDVNLIDNREDITLNVTPSVVEININSLTTDFTINWGEILGTLSDQTDLQTALDAKVAGSGTTNYIPKFTAASVLGNSNIQDSGSLITLGSNTTISSGALGIGTSSLTGFNLRVSKNITGAITSNGIVSEGQTQSDVTNTSNYFLSFASTSASSFTLTSLFHFRATQSTFGAGSTVTNQNGFQVDTNLVGATNNYGFRGLIPSGTNRWNLYMDGTASNHIAGSLGIGSTALTGYNLRIQKTLTGATASRNIWLDTPIASDVTSSAVMVGTSPNTLAASFTLNNLYHFYANSSTNGAGSSINNNYGFYADSNLIQGTNAYGFYGNIASGANRWNLYMAGTANNYLAGSLGIGTLVLTGYGINVAKAMTGATTTYGIFSQGQVQSDVTSSTTYFRTQAQTAAATFTLSNMYHYTALQGTFGAGSTVTNQYGFYVHSSLIGATNDYGFYGDIAAATNRWNIYMQGTAQNYLAGALSIGVTTANASALLQVDSTTKGFLPPRMTTTQKNAISTPATGLVVYDTTLNKLAVYTGSAWETVTSL